MGCPLYGAPLSRQPLHGMPTPHSVPYTKRPLYECPRDGASPTRAVTHRGVPYTQRPLKRGAPLSAPPRVPPAGSQHRTGGRPAPLRPPSPVVPGGALPWGAVPGRGGRPPLCPPPPPLRFAPCRFRGARGGDEPASLPTWPGAGQPMGARVSERSPYMAMFSAGWAGLPPPGYKSAGLAAGRSHSAGGSGPRAASPLSSAPGAASPHRYGPAPPPRGCRRLGRCARSRGVCGAGARRGWGGPSAAQRPTGPHPSPPQSPPGPGAEWPRPLRAPLGWGGMRRDWLRLRVTSRRGRFEWRRTRPRAVRGGRCASAGGDGAAVPQSTPGWKRRSQRS